jgi:uncharacterized protein
MTSDGPTARDGSAHYRRMSDAVDRSVLFDYRGKTIVEWLPQIVTRIATEFHPRRIILFGSLARGEADYDSDIDLLVELDRAPDKRAAAIAMRGAILDIPAPVDFLVTDPKEIARRGSIIGPALGTALHEGLVLYERA